MPWEKTFDIDNALTQATDVFWAKGYEATSLSDLLKAIGINKGSFYNAFGSKKKLFTQILLKYDQEQRAAGLIYLESLNNPVLAIETFFDNLIEQSLSDKQRKGCLLVNTALDLPNHDEGIEATIKKSFTELESFFERQIQHGITQEQIPAHIDAEKAAKGLLALVIALRVLARGVFDKAGLEAIKSQALKLLQ